MIQIDSVFDAYVNANILLALAFGLWLGMRFLLQKIGLGHGFSLQLSLLNGLFLAVLAYPIYVLGFGWLTEMGVLGPQSVIKISDLVVAQYLNGNLSIGAVQFQEVLGIRAELTADVLQMRTGFGTAIALGLIGGFVVFAARLVRSMWRLHRIVAGSHAWRRFGRVDLLLSDTMQVPFSTRGLRRRYVVIPTGMLAQGQDMRIAVAHELQHLRKTDIEWEMALEIAKPFLFWNPVFYAWKARVEQLRELSCDQEVLSRGVFDVRAYSQCLLRVCHNSLNRGPLLTVLAPTVPLIEPSCLRIDGGSVRALRQRFQTLLDHRVVAARPWAAVALLVPLCLAISLGAVALQKPSDWSHDRLMLSTIVNLDRLDQINGSVGN